jgi:hypothetical protein
MTTKKPRQSRADRRAAAPSRTTPAATGQPDATPPAPLRPRRGLFAALLVVLVLWVVFLVVMYLTTVYPQRPAPRQSSSALPGLAAFDTLPAHIRHEGTDA